MNAIATSNRKEFFETLFASSRLCVKIRGRHNGMVFAQSGKALEKTRKR
jgi:hypothetical protein